MASMQLTLLKDIAAKTGAYCLDGTPAAYYFKHGSNANSTKWVLFIQGGGWCYNEEDCARRAQTSLGSSARMNHTFTVGGPLGEDPVNNPNFHDWNHVMLGYCDGASFSGNVENPIDVGGKKIYFRGFRNLKAIMTHLLTKNGLNKATEVLLCGGSAGGLSVYLHADQIGEMLPSTVKRFKAIPMSGVFLDHPNAEGVPVYTPEIEKVFNMQNCSGGVNVHCLVSKSPRYMYMCMLAENTMQHTSTPLFIMNSKYDSWSTQCILGGEPETKPCSADGNCSAVPGWAACEESSTQCTPEQWKQISEWGDSFSDRIESNAAASARGNGLFEYSCHKHVAEFSSKWGVIKVGGTTMRDAISKWYFSKDEPASKHTYKDCRNTNNYCCNPTCCESSAIPQENYFY